MKLRLKEDWLTTHENPGLSPRYWVIAWGDHARGPSEKADLETACKDAYGMISHDMLVVDLGTRVAPIRSARYQAAAQNIRSLAANWWTGICQLDWDTLEIGQVADWCDAPYSGLLSKIDRLVVGNKSAQQLAFEAQLPAAAQIEDTQEAIQAIKTLWHKIFGTNPDEDPRLPAFVDAAGYEWPVSNVPWKKGTKLTVTLKEAHGNEQE